MLGDQPAELDRPDHECDRDRQARDRDVVEDLANRLGERPAVGEVHERAVDGVQQRHAGGEQDRQAQDRVPRQPRGARAPASTSSATSVAVSKPSPNSTPIGYICRAGDRLGQPAEEPVHQAAACRAAARAGLVVAARRISRKTFRIPTRITRLIAAITYRNVPDTSRPDPAGDLVQAGAVVLDRPGERPDPEREQERQREHDRRVARARTRTRRSSGACPRTSACGSCCRSRRCGRRRTRDASRACTP